MGVTWVQGNPAAFMDWGKGIEELVKREIQVILDDVINEAATKMREFISSRGLENSEGAGRIKSSDMLNSVGAKLNVSGNIIEGEFGWTENQEIYFLAQEEGAVLWNGGVIMPMLALYDAGQWAITEFVARIEKALGSA